LIITRCWALARPEAVCAKRWTETHTGLARIGPVVGTIILPLLLGEDNTVSVIKPLPEKSLRLSRIRSYVSWHRLIASTFRILFYASD
jgi:hypothetical protein